MMPVVLETVGQATGKMLKSYTHRSKETVSHLLQSEVAFEIVNSFGKTHSKYRFWSVSHLKEMTVQRSPFLTKKIRRFT